MRRIYMAAAVLTLLAVLTACGTAVPAPDSGTVTPAGGTSGGGQVVVTPPEDGEGDGSTANGGGDVQGALPGGTYSNHSVRLLCRLDDSWLFYNESQLLELNGVLTEGGSGDIATLAESGKAVYDMYAISTDGLMTMNVVFQNMGLLFGTTMSAQDYVELSAEQLPDAMGTYGFEDVTASVTTAEFAGAECPAIAITATVQDTPMYELLVCMKEGNYIYCVTLCSYTEDVTAQMAALFYTL